MQLLADESCDLRIVRGPARSRARYQNLHSGIADERAMSWRKIRISASSFSPLRRDNSGVLLIRHPANTRVGLIAERGESLYSCFVVLEPGRIRLGAWSTQKTAAEDYCGCYCSLADMRVAVQFSCTLDVASAASVPCTPGGLVWTLNRSCVGLRCDWSPPSPVHGMTAPP